MYEGPIPFDHRGQLVRYYGCSTKGPSAHLDSDYTWEDNKPFHTTLAFKEFERGRSSVNAIFEDKGAPVNIEVPMFLTDFEDVVVRGLSPLQLKGTFEYVKRGSNYGVKMYLIGTP